jgi:2-polyprenyl-6-methoxyphenol hydroxylase-like FAD-dependent oxidoreductase
VTESLERVVVVGASLAGLRAAETLRQKGFAGSVTVVGAELHRPYDRPPLSKKVLSGEWEPDRIQLRQPDSFDDLDVEWKFGVAASRLRQADKQIDLTDGTSLDSSSRQEPSRVACLSKAATNTSTCCERLTMRSVFASRLPKAASGSS